MDRVGRYTADGLRYFLLREGSFASDGSKQLTFLISGSSLLWRWFSRQLTFLISGSSLLWRWVSRQLIFSISGSSLLWRWVSRQLTFSISGSSLLWRWVRGACGERLNRWDGETVSWMTSKIGS